MLGEVKFESSLNKRIVVVNYSFLVDVFCGMSVNFNASKLNEGEDFYSYVGTEFGEIILTELSSIPSIVIKEIERLIEVSDLDKLESFVDEWESRSSAYKSSRREEINLLTKPYIDALREDGGVIPFAALTCKIFGK